MTLAAAKRMAEEIIIATVLGQGWKADWWHFEDEPHFDDLCKVILARQERLLHYIIEDWDSEGEHSPRFENDKMRCMCSTPFEMKGFTVNQKALYSEPGLKGIFLLMCQKCKRVIRLDFCYLGDDEVQIQTQQVR